jgi:TonB family protein
MAAMAGNRLLTPADSSARHFVEQMVAEKPDHELALADRDLLTTEMLSRSKQAVEGLDWDSARTWIDEAAKLEPDPAALAAAQETLTQGLITAEASQLLPASALEVVSYEPPEYPRSAVQRSIEGWVDLEFTVDENGRTKDIVVTDASNTRYFQDEAVEAVGKWRFEPRIFMDRAIPQRAYTRLNFVLADN